MDFSIWTTTLQPSCKVITTLQGCKQLVQMPQPCNNLVTTLQNCGKVVTINKFPYGKFPSSIIHRCVAVFNTHSC